MKLLIQENLSATYYGEPDSSPQDIEQDVEFWKGITELLDKYSVYYKLEHKSDCWLFEIPVQKINLSEENMNTLFHEALFLLEYELDYAGLGGKGCDFSLEMCAVKKLSCC